MSGKRANEMSADRLSEILARHEKLAVGIVVAVAMGIRLWHLFEMKANDPFFFLPSVDPKVFHEWAIKIAGGELLGDRVFFLSPLYPYFLGAVYAIFGAGFLVGKLVQMILGAACCVMIYTLGKRVFDMRTGFFAAVLFALYLPSIFYEGVLLVTGLQTPLNLLCVLLLLRAAASPSVVRWLVSGGLLGLSALARPNVLLLGGFVIVWLAWFMPRPVITKQKFIFAAVFSLGVGCAVFPVTIRNWVVGEDFVLVSSQGGVNFYIGNGPDATGSFVVPSLFPMTRADDPLQQEESYRKYAEQELGHELKPSEISGFWFARTWEHIGDDPGKWMGLLWRKLRLFFNYREIGNSRDFDSSRQFSTVLNLPLPVYGFIAPLALLGMALAVRRFRSAFFLYGMVGTYVASYVILFVLAHYRMPVLPFLILFSAHGIVWLADGIRQRKKVVLIAAIGLAVAIGITHAEVSESAESRFMIHYNLGNKYRLMEKHDLAVESYLRSIEENPHYISAYNNLGLTYEANPRNFGKAIKVWQQVLEMARARRDGMYIERAERHIGKLRELTGARRPPTTTRDTR